jgi:hypothetical protein
MVKRNTITVLQMTYLIIELTIAMIKMEIEMEMMVMAHPRTNSELKDIYLRHKSSIKDPAHPPSSPISINGNAIIMSISQTSHPARTDSTYFCANNMHRIKWHSPSGFSALTIL